MKTSRCAIYTRKSSEEGLDQSFNSLHAQREACEAYITSQKHEGWNALSAKYDDGGFSGGNMVRPGLKKLLEDIAAGKIDIRGARAVRASQGKSLFDKAAKCIDQIASNFDGMQWWITEKGLVVNRLELVSKLSDFGIAAGN